MKTIEADAERELLPCPFCGGKAIKTRPGRDIHCGNEHCPMTNVWARADTGILAAQCWNTRAQSPVADARGWKLVPDHADADAVVTSLYRRFKDWSKRGFGPDDVTWCEVRSDVLAMLATTSAATVADAQAERVYISGPITDMPELNKPAFDSEATRLKARGYSVYNPQDIPFPQQKLEGKELWRYFMKECIANIPRCTSIRMLPGWENSAGATEELRIAQLLGLQVEYCEGVSPVVAQAEAKVGDEQSFFDVVFDGPPSHESGRFVECEDASGCSFNAGEWIDRGNGLWALRIPLAAPSDAVDGASHSAISDAKIYACALMIKGICMTRPQSVWMADIEARIRFMLKRGHTTPEQIKGDQS